MSGNPNPTPVPQQPPTPAVHINVGPGGLEGLKLFEREIAAYRRELPRLLEQGQAGRHALVKGDEILSIWDKEADAIQAGRERFGLDPIFVKTIDPRDPERYLLLDSWLEARCSDCLS
jgi:hypothetical protein